MIDAKTARAELAQISPVRHLILDSVQRFAVTDDISMQVAADIDGQLADQLKTLKARDSQWAGPLRKIAREISAEVKSASEPLEQARSVLKHKITAYRQAKAAAQARALQEAQSSEEVRRAVVALTPKTPAGTAVRVEYFAEVIDPAAVPREFLVIDEAALRRVARESKGKAQIPGVRIGSRETIVRR